jgi:tetratricopeptide (TPR) repeat protein
MAKHQERWLPSIRTALFFMGLACSATAVPNNPAFLMAIGDGDAAFRKFDNRTALSNYLRAVEIDSSNYEALWKLARAYVDVGMNLPKKEQPEYYAFGEKMARRCAALYPDSSNGHFFLAVALGRVALYEGGKRKIQMAKEVKAEAERALQADPRHDGAMHVLGRWNYEFAELNFVERAVAKIIFGGLPSGASYEQAAGHFAEAVQCRPEVPVHHYELARTLIKLHRVDEAREHLEKCVLLPDLYWDDAQHKLAARKLLDKLRSSQ